jgi:citronellol/citronellal dehydrogenase
MTSLIRDPSVFRQGLFEGQHAFVTGGGTGIGWSIAAELRMLGANVTIASRSEEKLRAGAESLRAVDGAGEVHWTVCNIREEESIASAVESAHGAHGPITLLINNGGGQFPSPAMAIRRKGWDAVIETNLTGTFLMTQAFGRQVEESGAVVNIIAQMWNGFPMMAHTGAARAGVENLTKTLAFELAPGGVRVNAVAPGVILSSGVESYSEADRAFFFGSAEFIPAGRLGSPREVAAATVFLLSPAAAFITGTTLRVDGGEPMLGSASANQMRRLMSPRPTPKFE